jgi:hypothetical protein
MSAWQSMSTAPKDGTVIEVLSQNYGRASSGTTIYRTRWAKRAGKWLNWANLNEELCFARRWRHISDPAFVQPRQFTVEEERLLADLHSPEGVRRLPVKPFLPRRSGASA